MDAALSELLTPGDVASRLRTTSAFVNRLVKHGQIPHLVLPNGDVRFERAELCAGVTTFCVHHRESEVSE